MCKNRIRIKQLFILAPFIYFVFACGGKTEIKKLLSHKSVVWRAPKKDFKLKLKNIPYSEMTMKQLLVQANQCRQKFYYDRLLIDKGKMDTVKCDFDFKQFTVEKYIKQGERNHVYYDKGINKPRIIVQSYYRAYFLTEFYIYENKDFIYLMPDNRGRDKFNFSFFVNVKPLKRIFFIGYKDDYYHVKHPYTSLITTILELDKNLISIYQIDPINITGEGEEGEDVETVRFVSEIKHYGGLRYESVKGEFIKGFDFQGNSTKFKDVVNFLDTYKDKEEINRAYYSQKVLERQIEYPLWHWNGTNSFYDPKLGYLGH